MLNPRRFRFLLHFPRELTYIRTFVYLLIEVVVKRLAVPSRVFNDRQLRLVYRLRKAVEQLEICVIANDRLAEAFFIVGYERQDGFARFGVASFVFALAHFHLRDLCVYARAHCKLYAPVRHDLKLCRVGVVVAIRTIPILSVRHDGVFSERGGRGKFKRFTLQCR